MGPKNCPLGDFQRAPERDSDKIPASTKRVFEVKLERFWYPGGCKLFLLGWPCQVLYCLSNVPILHTIAYSFKFQRTQTRTRPFDKGWGGVVASGGGGEGCGVLRKGGNCCSAGGGGVFAFQGTPLIGLSDSFEQELGNWEFWPWKISSL